MNGQFFRLIYQFFCREARLFSNRRETRQDHRADHAPLPHAERRCRYPEVGPQGAYAAELRPVRLHADRRGHGESLFFPHYDPKTGEWFMTIV